MKLSKKNVFDLHLKKRNPFGISVPCIYIENSELLFEKNRMALNWEKYDIEFRNNDATNRNQISFGFMQTNVQSYGYIIFT